MQNNHKPRNPDLQIGIDGNAPSAQNLRGVTWKRRHGRNPAPPGSTPNNARTFAPGAFMLHTPWNCTTSSQLIALLTIS